MIFAVNGTLMRGLLLNHVLIEAGAKFIREVKTAPQYRLWSIQDRYPGMLRDNESGTSILLELWEISREGLIEVLENEPSGLSVGKIIIEDGTTVFGVLAEPHIIEDCIEITKWGGWRSYIKFGQITPTE